MDWKEYKIRYKYKNSIYDILVQNPNESDKNEIKEFYLDNNKIDEKCIRINDNGEMHKIKIILE